MPHPTLLGGHAEVEGAGVVRFQKGQIVAIDNASGHYKPGRESLAAIEEVFARFPRGSSAETSLASIASSRGPYNERSDVAWLGLVESGH